MMYLGAAKKATEKEQPKKQNVLSNIESAIETLEATSKTVDAGKKLWDKAKAIIIKIVSWLGVATAGSNLLNILGF